MERFRARWTPEALFARVELDVLISFGLAPDAAEAPLPPAPLPGGGLTVIVVFKNYFAQSLRVTYVCSIVVSLYWGYAVTIRKLISMQELIGEKMPFIKLVPISILILLDFYKKTAMP